VFDALAAHDVPHGTCTELVHATLDSPNGRTENGASARERLLAGRSRTSSEHGVGEISLRAMAAALGTSHRMLIYHFGSREGC
jgi:AcrR family transcriptional regulator